MEQAGGRMDIMGSLVTQRANFHQATVNVSLDNVDVSKVFTAFNNFGQNGITAQNLSGKLSAKVNATVGLNDEGKVDPNSIQAL